MKFDILPPKGNQMNERLMSTFMAFAAITISPTVFAEQRLDIVQILGQFVQANHAANKCIKPDEETLARFLNNFKIVTFRANDELKRRYPEQSDQQIVAGLRQRTIKVEAAIDEVIRTSGCGDPRIQDLLKRFEIQANLRL